LIPCATASRPRFQARARKPVLESGRMRRATVCKPNQSTRPPGLHRNASPTRECPRPCPKCPRHAPNSGLPATQATGGIFVRRPSYNIYAVRANLANKDSIRPSTMSGIAAPTHSAGTSKVFGHRRQSGAMSP